MKLNDLTVSDNFYKVTCMADTLASIGKALGSEEFTSYVLNGLSDDCDNLVENINGRDTPIQPRELYARLLATHTQSSLSACILDAAVSPQSRQCMRMPPKHPIDTSPTYL